MFQTLQPIVLVIHLLLAIALVGVVLMQRSEGGALGIGGGGMSGFMTGRGQANLLTRATTYIAAIFMVTSLLLAWLSTVDTTPRSILDRPAATSTETPAEPAAPAAPAEPTVPLGQ